MLKDFSILHHTLRRPALELHNPLPWLTVPKMATKAVSAEKMPDAKKLIGGQGCAVDVSQEKAETRGPSQHREKSLGESEDADSSKSKKEDDAITGAEKNKGSIGDYFVSPCSKLSLFQNTDCGCPTASLSIYRHARPTAVRDRHLRCCCHWRCIAVDDPGLRIINKFDQ